MNTLRDLIGQPLVDNHPELGPRKLRPRADGMLGTTPKLEFAHFKFAYEDYAGELKLGFKTAYVDKRQGRVIKTHPYVPVFNHNLWRPAGRYTECHNEWDEVIAAVDSRESEAMIEAIFNTLNPSAVLANMSHVYVIKLQLIEAYEAYLASYFQRPKTLETIAWFKENT